MNVAFALICLTMVLYKGILYTTDPTLKDLSVKLPQSKNTTTLAVLNIIGE